MSKEMELIIQNQLITNSLLTLLVTSSLGGDPLRCANLLDECVDDAIKAGIAFKALTNTLNKE